MSRWLAAPAANPTTADLTTADLTTADLTAAAEFAVQVAATVVTRFGARPV
jgi:sugar/nucleoside kinase (ribokinase family)